MADTEIKNPLLDINTSFTDYLSARTRTSNDHLINGKMDYAFDNDYVLRNKLGSVSGWSKLHKQITSSELPNEFKKVFRSTDIATSMLYPKIYNAVNKCSEKLLLNVPTVLVKTAKGSPEIYSLSGDGIESCIVISSDIVDICSDNELCFLAGCELGRIQNGQSAYRFAFNALCSSSQENDDSFASGKIYSDALKQSLARWTLSSDISADRAGIICLDDPETFVKTYINIRKKCIPDSFNEINTEIDESDVLAKFESEHKTPVRTLKLSEDTTNDDRRIMAGLEFIGCEILYSWRPDIDNKSGHFSNKQTLEIRCDILAGSGSAETV